MPPAATIAARLPISANDLGRARVAIESVTPVVDGGRWPVKRIAGDTVCVEADVFADSHDILSAVVLYWFGDAEPAAEAELCMVENDRWRGEFTVSDVGGYHYTIHAWVDRYASWRRDLRKRLAAEQDVAVELLVGADLVGEAGEQADGPARQRLAQWEAKLHSAAGAAEVAALATAIVDDAELAAEVRRFAPRRHVSRSATFPISVDRPLARFGAWYEMFPRSAAASPRHGTLRDVIQRLPYIAAMGFDIVYLPPIHPIGHTHRKGRNNSRVADDGDVGSPWAIGSPAGGHKAIHPELGDLDDFAVLVSEAQEHGLEIALDIALQCSPDHPYVAEHPEWFRQLPDGTIRHAENPPKRYEDIYPFDFECDDWEALWEELKSIFLFWIECGVTVLRVDNPHTKPFPFWQWLIAEVKCEYPEVIFLSEAFTRPKIMNHLAKLGFTQSYTYFTWRDSKRELTEYFTQLSETRDFFRPNLWPNTPDILTEHLQYGGAPTLKSRLILAATLAPSYGIYGPVFELGEVTARQTHSEEYLHSEKYEVRHFDWESPDSLQALITSVNRIRRESVALQTDSQLCFHNIDNDDVVCYSKSTPDRSDVVLVVVNLNPNHRHSGWIELPPELLPLPAGRPFRVCELLTGVNYMWHGPKNFVELDPHTCPGQIFHLRQAARHEGDFEYFAP